MYIKYVSVKKSILLHKNYNLFKSKFHCTIVAVNHIQNQISEGMVQPVILWLQWIG